MQLEQLDKTVNGPVGDLIVAALILLSELTVSNDRIDDFSDR